MAILKEKLTEAIEAKSNDVNTFVWKFPKKSDKTQEEIKMMDATKEQLQQFYNHCISMLYSKDKINPGRYVLLNMIKEQWEKCNVEIYLRKLNAGSITADHKSYPRHIYLRTLQSFLDANKDVFPPSELRNIPISTTRPDLPKEFEDLNIESVREGCLDQLGYLNVKHITYNFLISLGIYLTPEEMKEFNSCNEGGTSSDRMNLIKEALDLRPNTRLIIKPSGLSFSELRAMLRLRTEKYSRITTEQLEILRNKVLFYLEQEVKFHIEQWERIKTQILKVCEVRGIELNK